MTPLICTSFITSQPLDIKKIKATFRLQATNPGASSEFTRRTFPSFSPGCLFASPKTQVSQRFPTTSSPGYPRPSRSIRLNSPISCSWVPRTRSTRLSPSSRLCFPLLTSFPFPLFTRNNLKTFPSSRCRISSRRCSS